MKTALVYSKAYLKHNTGPGHPECPERARTIFEFLRKSDIYHRLILLNPRAATLEELELIHPRSYMNRVRETCLSGARMIDSIDTAICPKSFEIALLAAGGVLTLIDAVMERKADNGFALIRPPGHHAERETALGFCLFNNIAIAARYLQTKYQLKKILIIDWDVHHGNGTQHIFEEDPNVFYFSTHQYPYYPGTGSAFETGRGKGEGMTLNIPLQAGSGDKEYRKAFKEIFYPKAIQFKPEFILISCGFDAHAKDPLAHMNLTEESYGYFTDVAREIAQKSGHERIASALEGGYHLEMISRSAYIHLKHLMQ
jgi:acetoin utilization deacetylase AcuC-like enzyme